ncbi:MAG TPA: hypothetical protein VGR95_19970, partial [Thermoanaerobaculia bacterium]|nr:hypothetical protein [Thermoanaerobaculia bacterium]
PVLGHATNDIIAFMAVSLMQRIRLWWRGSQRRREEKEQAFLAKNAAWTPALPTPASPPRTEDRGPRTEIDREGLQAAYLDRSGVILYYLDKETGEVVESRSELTDSRYARVPTQSDEDDQRAFLRTLTLPQRAHFQKVESFRAAIAEDRTLEKAWYNFKNDRATKAIEAWLNTV